MTNGFSYKPYNIPIYMYRFTWLFCTQNFLRIISAVPDAEINTDCFQMRGRCFHDYYFFLWRNKNHREYGYKEILEK